MAQSTTHDSMAAYLQAHPRMMGVLFTICLLLTQAGNASANVLSTIAGP